VTREFGRYMHEHRVQADGVIRDSDNWQKGIPKDAYVKSLVRHVEDVKLIHRGYPATDFTTGADVSMKDALCAVLFNVQGLLHEILTSEIPRTTIGVDFAKEFPTVVTFSRTPTHADLWSRHYGA
jgi:hypothetical protein